MGGIQWFQKRNYEISASIAISFVVAIYIAGVQFVCLGVDIYLDALIHKYFPDIFCINLARRKDRWAEFQQEAQKHSIDWVRRFEAVDGNDIDYKPVVSADGQIPSRGDLGCTLSHCGVAKIAKENRYPNYVVFEDDVVFDDRLSHLFVEFLGDVPKDWAIIYLGGSHIEKPEMVSDMVGRVRLTYTTHAMIVRETVYDDLIRIWEQGNEKVDVALAEVQRLYPCYAFMPPLAWQRPSFSDILNLPTDYVHLRPNNH